MFVDSIRNSARYLWRRIPPSVKAANVELVAVWRIGRALWSKNYAEVYSAIRDFSWSDPAKSLVQLLEGSFATLSLSIERFAAEHSCAIAAFVALSVESFRDATFSLLSKSYTAISLGDCCNYLGLAPAETVARKHFEGSVACSALDSLSAFSLLSGHPARMGVRRRDKHVRTASAARREAAVEQRRALGAADQLLLLSGKPMRDVALE